MKILRGRTKDIAYIYVLHLPQALVGGLGVVMIEYM